MSLQELVNNFGKEKEFGLEEKNEIKKLSEILDRRFNILQKYLNDKKIFTTGQLKSLESNKYFMLKSDIPKLPGVGEDKTKLFLDKLDEIRNTRYFSDSKKIVGYIGDVNKWHIEINHLKLDEKEYIDIRKIGPDGTRLKGISLKLDEVRDLIVVLKEYFEEDDQENKSLLDRILKTTRQNKITTEMIEAVYEYGKKVINNEITTEVAVSYLNSEFSMNKSSIKMYINALDDMLKGLTYTRKINKEATEYYLENIKKDFGIIYFQLALSSVRKNIMWNRQFNPNDLKGMEQLVNNIEKKYKMW